MGLKHLTEFKLFEEVDAFSRAGDKLWVVLKSSGVRSFKNSRNWLRDMCFMRFENDSTPGFRKTIIRIELFYRLYDATGCAGLRGGSKLLNLYF